MGKRNDTKYTLTVPLDASQVDDRGADDKLKVAVATGGAVLQSQTVKLNKSGTGRATFTFDGEPAGIRVLVGPEDAADEDIVGLQTLSADVSAAALAQGELTLRPIVIAPYYWWWWRRWCRTFTVRGRVICPDGSPVPGAEVCAYDVDWWFFYSSTQLLGCATTDTGGAFSLTFRWCCGWWPWWWWRLRRWTVDPDLIARINPVLQRDPDLRLHAPGTQPDLSIFEHVLGESGFDLRTPLQRDPTVVEKLREPLLARLPSAPELEVLRIWPWWPWRPWWDCNPDLIFKVSQDCFGQNTVIVDEGIGDTRWNVDINTIVTLIATDDACCIPPPCPQPPCPEGDCVVIDTVCASQIDQVGGNQMPALAPEGYLYPGPVPANATHVHRPFAGTVPISKIGTMVGIDYYEILDDSLNPLPAGAERDFRRTYWDTATLSWGTEPFQFLAYPGLPPGHRAVKTREHHEATSGLTWDQPGADRFWSINRDLLVPLETATFPDGTYRFKVRGWTEGGGGVLINPQVLPVCGSNDDEEFALTFDNRVPPPEPGHPVSHNCGAGIHTCTSEPDCHIMAVRVNGTAVGICETVEDTTGTLEVDVMINDPDGHLAYWSLDAEYGLSGNVSLIPVGSLTALAGFEGPTYGQAIAQGATAPYWTGGVIRYTADLEDAFPVPCCYQLVLRVYKRNVVGSPGPGHAFSCNYNSPYRNQTQFTIGIGVCAQQPA